MRDDEAAFGPIVVVVIGYRPGAPMTGRQFHFYPTSSTAGIRVLDALFVQRDADGTFSGFDLANLDADTAGDLAVFAGACTGMLKHDAAPAAAEIEPGSAAVLIAYENRLAAPFIAAVQRNGGVLIANEPIGVQTLIDALDAAEAAA